MGLRRRRSLASACMLAFVLCGCRGDPPSETPKNRDAGGEAGDARSEAGDAPSEAGDAPGETGGETGQCSTRGAGCNRSGAAGVCNEFGACVECLAEDAGQCAGATPHCTTAFTCVECTLNSHCNPTTEKCKNGSCIIRCGDGTIDPDEDCEQGIPGWTSSNCNFTTCKRTVYENCRGDSTRCAHQGLCSAAFSCLETSDSNCVTSCPSLPGFVIGCSSGLCYIDCATSPCPFDTNCKRGVSVASKTVDMCFGN
jgi:hypothetical protein